MLGIRACIGTISAVVWVLLVAVPNVRAANANDLGGCRTASAARSPDSGCYLLAARSVDRSRKGRAETDIADLSPMPAADARATEAAVEQERNRSNQLTILGWIACVYLFAKGLEFALSPALYGRQEDGVTQPRFAAVFAAAAICIAAVVLFALLTLQARQARPTVKDYSTLSDCLQEAQTVDEIRACGTRTYNRPSAP